MSSLSSAKLSRVTRPHCPSASVVQKAHTRCPINQSVRMNLSCVENPGRQQNGQAMTWHSNFREPSTACSCTIAASARTKWGNLIRLKQQDSIPKDRARHQNVTPKVSLPFGRTGIVIMCVIPSPPGSGVRETRSAPSWWLTYSSLKCAS